MTSHLLPLFSVVSVFTFLGELAAQLRSPFKWTPPRGAGCNLLCQAEILL